MTEPEKCDLLISGCGSGSSWKKTEKNIVKPAYVGTSINQ
jgi:hypothetical protein